MTERQGSAPRRDDKPARLRFTHLAATALIASLGLAGCASTNGKIATKTTVQTAKMDPKLGVKPSPRVVADGKPIPKGGGREMVGKTYKVAGKTYTPRHDPKYAATGLASWYGDAFHGRYTANGEIYDMNHLSAAHTTMPLPSYARVTSVDTGRSVIVRVNDRGPFHGNRVIDLSKKAAEMLGVRRAGVAKVKIDYVGRAPTEGDDTRYLMASYRGPADAIPSSAPTTMIASAQPLPGVTARPAAASASAARKVPATTAPAAAPAAEPPVQTVLIAALPPTRPVEADSGFMMVAAIDPAEAFFASSAATMVAQAPVQQPAPTLVAAAGAEPAPVLRAAMRPADEAAAILATPATAFDDAADPALIAPLPPEQPLQRSSYAAERIDGAFAGRDGFESGRALSELSSRLAARSQPAPIAAAAGGPTIQFGVFADPANARRVAESLGDFGTIAIDSVTAGERTLQRVRLVALADGIDVDTVLAAATRAGVTGAKVLR